MKFIYSEWESFCKDLSIFGLHSVTASSILKKAQEGGIDNRQRFINLKHDVETQPQKALDLAKIEHKYGHCSTYYVQAYLMTKANQAIFQEIQEMGHEVTYHHDVMDGSNGILKDAIEIYKKNIELFDLLGFKVHTVCQHGNPVSNYENRDFFRSNIVQEQFPNHSDIMVDFMDKIKMKYIYISDVGMSFKIIIDPVNSDKIKEESQKYIELGNLDTVIKEISTNTMSYIVSAHPHRYNKSLSRALIRKYTFKTIKFIAKVMFLIPGVKKILFRFNSITKHL